jgi:probable HAF family extracellular repeat protein
MKSTTKFQAGALPRTLFPLLLAAAALWSLPDSAQAQAPQYSVTILESSQPTNADGINDSGQVTGASYFDGAVVWSGMTTEILGNPAAGGSAGAAINDSGEVAGSFSPTGIPYTEPVIWNGTTQTVLGTLTGSYNTAIATTVTAINNLGQVAGYSPAPDSPEGTGHAVVWTGTTPTDLGSLAGANGSSYAYGINDSGQVAGYSDTPSAGIIAAVRWTNGTPETLDNLGGYNISYGYAINASGQVVGNSYSNVTGDEEAVLWNGTTPTGLGTLGGATSYAYGINDSGEVIGMSLTSADASTAFLYIDGTMYDLDSLLLPGSDVTDLIVGENCINSSGQIAATGNVNGVDEALLLTPVAVPEPSTWLMLAAGTASFIAFRRRR